MKLILFDIDGTLLWTNGAGRRAMEASLRRHFGSVGPSDYRYDGKTDMQIVRECMRAEGHDDAHIDRALPNVLADYLQGLDDEIEKNPAAVQRFDGVLELIEALEARSDRVVGLLTGNVVTGASRKLQAVGIDPFRFRVGAFGSDHEHRHELPAIALTRAREAHGLALQGHQAVIVGDTPADIHCGRGIGARAIAVATGHYTVDQLRAHAPTAAFTSLADTQAVMQAIDDA